MLFCKHKMEKVSQVVLESAFEQIVREVTKWKGQHLEPVFFRKKVVIVLTCSKCGKVKTITERNP